MTCLPGLGAVPEGYNLHEPLPHSSPTKSVSKFIRLVAMARSDNDKVRAAVAGNPNAPELLLLELSQDKSLLVRSWVARNPQCPVNVLERFAASDDDLASYARWKLSQVVH